MALVESIVSAHQVPLLIIKRLTTILFKLALEDGGSLDKPITPARKILARIKQKWERVIDEVVAEHSKPDDGSESEMTDEHNGGGVVEQVMTSLSMVTVLSFALKCVCVIIMSLHRHASIRRVPHFSDILWRVQVLPMPRAPLPSSI